MYLSLNLPILDTKKIRWYENKIRKALVLRLKKDFDLQFLLENTNVA